MQNAYEFLTEKLRSEKREKNYFFCKLNTKDGNVFTQIYIYDNNSNTYMFIYIKIVYTFLIKLSATTKQLIRSNSICCLKNLAIFFHRVNIEIGFSPPLPMFAFIQSLKHPPPPPQQTFY